MYFYNIQIMAHFKTYTMITCKGLTTEQATEVGRIGLDSATWDGSLLSLVQKDGRVIEITDTTEPKKVMGVSVKANPLLLLNKWDY